MVMLACCGLALSTSCGVSGDGQDPDLLTRQDAGGTGGGTPSVGGPCNFRSDCTAGQMCVEHVCQTDASDAGRLCTRDEDCDSGLVCLRSRGACVKPVEGANDGGLEDGGALACEPGTNQTCGVSKLGECRLGVKKCELNDAGVYDFTPCLGAVNPVPELCDGLDNDCNGLLDDGFVDATCGVGACLRTAAVCIDGQTNVCMPGAPSAEQCNGIDDDCDGQVDQGLPDLACGVGSCARKVVACVKGMPQTCMPGTPSAEVCDGADNDCNGMVDDGLADLGCGLGACRRITPACVGGQPQTCTPGAPSAEVCNGIDDDCDGVVDNGVCVPGATCSAGSTVNPNTTVTLTTTATSSPGHTVSCAWSVVSRPATSNGTFSAPTNCTASTYFADVVGTHVLRFTVTDSGGTKSSCDTTIVVQPLGGLWVELTWDIASDVDLHLLHPMAGNNHASGSWTGTYDDFYSNPRPSWDATGNADDPSLDRDDTQGKGPENTRINAPSTTHPYTIGVHMYSFGLATGPINATVRLYCGGVLKTTQSHTLTKVKDLWVMGTVSFNSSNACTFTPDNLVLNHP